MNWLELLHAYHRFARYRWRSERAELRYLLGREFDGGSVFDVGACRGVYSYWMHRYSSDTQIVAFEPQLEMFEYLHDLRKTFKLERLKIIPFGLSSRPGMLTMHRPRRHWAAATVDEYCYDDEQTEVFNVPMTTIDQYVAEHPELRPVRFIKCDVEYHEAEVLIGAERTLREDRPELLVAWWTPRRSYRERLFRLAQRVGYSIHQFEYGRLTPCTTAERRCPPSWELGPNYVLRPVEVAAAAAA